MHDVAIFGILANNIRNDLTESIRVKALINLLNGGMYILFGGRNTTPGISV
jgi:hypothetical protein